MKKIKRDQETQQQKIDNFTRKRNIKRLFKTIQNEIEVEDTRCAICLGIMKHNDPITITKCKHKFHSACLKEWLTRSKSCPICREPIRENGSERDAARRRPTSASTWGAVWAAAASRQAEEIGRTHDLMTSQSWQRR